MNEFQKNNQELLLLIDEWELKLLQLPEAVIIQIFSDRLHIRQHRRSFVYPLHPSLEMRKVRPKACCYSLRYGPGASVFFRVRCPGPQDQRVSEERPCYPSRAHHGAAFH